MLLFTRNHGFFRRRLFSQRKAKRLFCQLIPPSPYSLKIWSGFVMSLRITELSQHIGGYVNFPFEWEKGKKIRAFHASSLIYSCTVAPRQLLLLLHAQLQKSSAALLIISQHLAMQFETAWLCNNLWEALESNLSTEQTVQHSRGFNIEICWTFNGVFAPASEGPCWNQDENLLTGDGEQIRWHGNLQKVYIKCKFTTIKCLICQCLKNNPNDC